MAQVFAFFKSAIAAILAFFVMLWTLIGGFFKGIFKPKPDPETTTAITTEIDSSTETTFTTTETTTESTTFTTTESTTQWTPVTTETTSTVAPAINSSVTSFGGTMLDKITGSYAKGSYSYVCGESQSRDEDMTSILPNAAFLTPYGFIAKYGPSGDREWTIALTNSSNGVHPTDITVYNSKIYVCGYLESKSYVETAFVAKYDLSGTQEWLKTYTGNNNDYFNCIAATSDGIVIGGKTNSTTGSFTLDEGDDYTKNRAIIVKIDSTGTITDSKYYAGSENSEITDIDTDESGNIFAVISTIASDGKYADFTNLVNGSMDNIVVKFGSDGKLAWYYTLSTSGRDNMNCVAADGNGGCLAGGYFECNENIISTGSLKGKPVTGGIEAYIVKIDSSGAKTWDKLITGDKNEVITDIIKVKNGFAVVGYTSSTSGELSIGFDDYDGFAYIVSNAGKKISYQVIGGTEKDVVSTASFSGSTLMLYGYSLSKDCMMKGLCTHSWSDSTGSYPDCFAAQYTTNL